MSKSRSLFYTFFALILTFFSVVRSCYAYKFFRAFVSVLLFSALLLGNVKSSIGATFLDSLPNRKPKQILRDRKDRFFIDYSSQVFVFSDKVDYIVKIKDPDTNYGSSGFQTNISSSGTVYSVFKSSYTPEESKTTYHHLNLAECIRDDCNYKLLYTWSTNSDSKYPTSYDITSQRISKKDTHYLTIDYSYYVGKKEHTVTHYYYGKQKVSKAQYLAGYSNDFTRPASGVEVKNTNTKDESKEQSFLQWAKRKTKSITDTILNVKVGEDSAWFRLVTDIGDTEFKVDDKLVKGSKKRSSRYKRTIVWDRNEAPHIFFHDPGDRKFYHRFYSREKNKVVEKVVDQSESGLESLAFATDDELWSIHYYYRNPFNKGLLVTVHQLSDGHIKNQFQIDASKSRNSGWDLVGGESSNHRILFTYLSDKQNKKREYVLLNNVEELKKLSITFNEYGNPNGKGFPANPPTESFKQSRSKGYLNVGTGVQYVIWSMDVGKPNEESNVGTPYEPEYTLSDSILNIFSLEGKYGSTNFGLKYATKFLDKKVQDNGSNDVKKFNKLATKISWDNLIFNYDLKVDYENLRSQVFFEDKSNQVPDKKFISDFQEIKISLLTLRRHHFGLIYQTYNFYQPAYIYKSSIGSTSFSFLGQAIGDIDVNNYFLHYGYSSLDYMTKYETEINDWFFDGEIRGGLSFADFNGELTATNNLKPEGGSDYGFGTQLELGWIWYKRWEILKNIGGSIKISYRLDLSIIGDSSKPKDKDTASTQDDLQFKFERREVRHGPLLFISFNL